MVARRGRTGTVDATQFCSPAPLPDPYQEGKDGPPPLDSLLSGTPIFGSHPGERARTWPVREDPMLFESTMEPMGQRQHELDVDTLLVMVDHVVACCNGLRQDVPTHTPTTPSGVDFMALCGGNTLDPTVCAPEEAGYEQWDPMVEVESTQCWAEPNALILGCLGQQEEQGSFQISTLPPLPLPASSLPASQGSPMREGSIPVIDAMTCSVGGGTTTIINNFISEVRVALPSLAVRQPVRRHHFDLERAQPKQPGMPHSRGKPGRSGTHFFSLSSRNKA
jgi:hypothetical protein